MSVVTNKATNIVTIDSFSLRAETSGWPQSALLPSRTTTVWVSDLSTAMTAGTLCSQHTRASETIVQTKVNSYKLTFLPVEEQTGL